MSKKNLMSKNQPSWQETEHRIYQEILWLRSAIETFFNEERSDILDCKECILRKIAILIVSGEIHAKEIVKKPPLKSFWRATPLRKSHSLRQRSKMRHGGEWHRDTMEKIEQHFLAQGYQVEREPNIHWGRADLGVYKKGVQALYIEVGTTSLLKLLINLTAMRDFTYLIVPNDDKLVEFRRDRNDKYGEKTHKQFHPLKK